MFNAQWSETHSNVRVWHRERFIAGPWKRRGVSNSKIPQTSKRVSAKHFFFFAILTLFFLIFNIFFICSEFCHTLKWNSHRFTCVPHPDPPSHLPLHRVPLGFPSAPGPSACLMHPTWAGDLFHPRYYTCFDAVLLKHPTLAFSHRV